MLNTIIISLIIVLGLMITWYFIQNLWRQTFADEISDEDVLAERNSCGNCGCQTTCQLETQEYETIDYEKRNIYHYG